jgi:hypothetical protein
MQNAETRQTEGISRAKGSFTNDSGEPFLCLIKGFCTLKMMHRYSLPHMYMVEITT